jgi:hypothetical protein
MCYTKTHGLENFTTMERHIVVHWQYLLKNFCEKINSPFFTTTKTTKKRTARRSVCPRKYVRVQYGYTFLEHPVLICSNVAMNLFASKIICVAFESRGVRGKQSLHFSSDIDCVMTLGHVYVTAGKQVYWGKKRTRLNSVMLDKWGI